MGKDVERDGTVVKVDAEHREMLSRRHHVSCDIMEAFRRQGTLRSLLNVTRRMRHEYQLAIIECT